MLYRIFCQSTVSALTRLGVSWRPRHPVLLHLVGGSYLPSSKRHNTLLPHVLQVKAILRTKGRTLLTRTTLPLTATSRPDDDEDEAATALRGRARACGGAGAC